LVQLQSPVAIRVDSHALATTQWIIMPLNIRSQEVNRLAEQLAARKGLNKTEAVKLALENELRRLDEAVPLKDRLRPIQDRMQKRPLTGLTADKEFYDSLNDEE